MKIFTIYISVIILFNFFNFFLLIQAQEIKINNESKDTTKVIKGVWNYLDVNNLKWVTIGSNFDLFNSTFGFLISNGFDERPIKHFEDFSERFIYKVRGQTNLKKIQSIGGNFAWQYPIKRLSYISIGYMQHDYTDKEIFFRDFNISVMTHLNFVDAGLTFKTGHQSMNGLKNYGGGIGILKVIAYRRLYYGLTIDYFFDYFAYSASLQFFVYKDIISLRMDYERINNYDFMNIGLNFTFKR